MTKYLHRKTTKHLTRYHYLAADGIHPLSRRCPQVEAGKRGWQVVERDDINLLTGLCWHCQEEYDPHLSR